MIGISPKLPMSLSPNGGHLLNETHESSVAQNFKNLILTCPGEKMMDPLFGVGLRNFLFENDTAALKREIFEKIKKQTHMYMPFISLDAVNISSSDKGRGSSITSAASLTVSIRYSIIPLNVTNLLTVDV